VLCGNMARRGDRKATPEGGRNIIYHEGNSIVTLFYKMKEYIHTCLHYASDLTNALIFTHVVCTVYTVNSCYTGPRYSESLVIPDEPEASGFLTTKLPLAIPGGHTILDRTACKGFLTPASIHSRSISPC